ncbi:MAG: NAD-dependent epimerase/dehydratase family protein [Deltaproteobacteria bacterium]|nr:NAD-dependent epimerase/dehydratase family protein [Deltaproteobacteria bacterium]
MRVLVTGAAGFCGRHLCAALRARGHEAWAAGHDAAYPVDFRLLELVAELFTEARPDLVFHLAGTSHPGDFHRGPVEVQTENIVHPLLNVLECAGNTRVVLASSAVVYGRGPTTEDSPMRPADLYGAARASAEAMAQRHVQRGGDVVIARATGITGPGQHPRFLLAGWAHRYAGGERRIATGNLELRRDYIDVRDAAEALVLLGERGERGSSYNLCSGDALPLRELFVQLCPGAESTDGGAPSRELPVIAASPARAEALGWQRRHALAQTLVDLRQSVSPSP